MAPKSFKAPQVPMASIASTPSQPPAGKVYRTTNPNDTFTYRAIPYINTMPPEFEFRHQVFFGPECKRCPKDGKPLHEVMKVTRADIFDDYKSAPTPKQFAGYIKIFGGMFNSNWHALPVDMDCGEKEKAAVKRAKFHLRTLHNVSSLFTISSTRPPLINPLTRLPCTHPHEESAFHFLEPTVPIPFLSEVFNRGEITQMRTNFRRREAKLEPPLNLEDDEFLYMDEAEMVHYEDGIEVKRDRMVRRGGLGERDGEAIKGRQGVGRRRVAVADMGVPKVREGKKEEESSGEVETEEEFSESEDEEEENGEGEDSYKEEGRGTVRRRELEDQVEMEMMMDWFQKRKWY